MLRRSVDVGIREEVAGWNIPSGGEAATAFRRASCRYASRALIAAEYYSPEVLSAGMAGD